MDDVPGMLSQRDKLIVQADTPCRRCSYNLRGLKQDGRCPECGTPVGVSTLGEQLGYSDPRWLARLSWGTGLLLIEVIAYIVIFIIPFFVYPGAWRTWILPVRELIGLVGVWLLTTRDPSGLGEAQYGRARAFVRVVLAMELGWLAIVFSFVQFETLSTYQMERLGFKILRAAGEFCMFIYFGRLAGRIPNSSLIKIARFLQWTSPPLAVLSAVLYFVLVRSSGGPNLSNLTSLFLLLSPIQMLLYIVMLFYYTLMLRTIREQHAVSRRVWHDAAAG